MITYHIMCTPGPDPSLTTRDFPNTLWQQYYVLQGRALWAYTRNPANVAGRSLMTIAIAVIEGAAFMHASSGRGPILLVYHL